MDFGKESKLNASRKVTNLAGGVVSRAERLVRDTEDRLEKTVAPVRENVIKRFPVLFMLAVTFGITATATGAEQIILQYDTLKNNPWLIFGFGLIILFLTGTVYKNMNKS